MTTTLKPRHEAFALSYAEANNATAAYIAAGFSRRGAAVSASRLLRSPRVAARVREIRAEIAKRLAENTKARQAEAQASAEVLVASAAERKQRTLEELEILAFSDVANYAIRDDGTVTVRGELPAHLSRAIEAMEVTRHRIPQRGGGEVIETKTRFKLWSKPTALKMLGDHERLFGEQPEVARSGERPEQVFIIAGREVYL